MEGHQDGFKKGSIDLSIRAIGYSQYSLTLLNKKRVRVRTERICRGGRHLAQLGEVEEVQIQ
jgi:hypothetical protein